MELFGFTINRKQKEKERSKDQKNTFVSDDQPDGSVSLAAGSAYGGFYDLDGMVKTEGELVTKYREMALTAEIEFAVDEITNEAIIHDDEDIVTLDLSKLEYSESIKKKIIEEFDNVKNLLQFNHSGYDFFRRWYVDGRIYFQIIIDPENPRNGIKELRYIDPRKIRKVREYEKKRINEKTFKKVLSKEYFVYSENGFGSSKTTPNVGIVDSTVNGLKISADSIIYVPSGLMDSANKMVLSYLNKSIKPLNQLKALEDAVVIYRIARAPERRVFYIDVGNLPKGKAEQYLQEIMSNYKNKLTYDVNTGNIKDDRRNQAMLEDYWLPRREGGRGTEIDTLRGGEQLGEVKDLEYFLEKLYKSLNIPMSRIENDSGFSFSRSTEIKRDELKFFKFVSRLRRKFSDLFAEALKTQLLLKQIISEEDWDYIYNNMNVKYAQDNHFTELNELDIFQVRNEILERVSDKIGVWYSRKFVYKKILNMTDDEISQIQNEIQKDKDWKYNPTLSSEEPSGGENYNTGHNVNRTRFPRLSTIHVGQDDE